MSEPTLISGLGPHQTALVLALESGEYKQLKGRLTYNYEGFCCLGVACDVAAKAAFGCWESGRFIVDGLSSYHVLPLPIVHYYRFHGCLGDLRIKLSNCPNLTTFNDSDEEDIFPRIAAFMRTNPTAVFSEPV